MNIMQDPNDQMLEQMLSEQPEIADDGFSAEIGHILDKRKENRRLILGLTYLFGFLIVLALTPWTNFTPWLDIFSGMLKDVTVLEGMTTAWKPFAIILIPIAFFLAFLQREFE
ncbi:MAG: hypothetical protein KAI89_09635 [Emcibacter sp.]|nr:hypothetical protein [Emcibacter sp.]